MNFKCIARITQATLTYAWEMKIPSLTYKRSTKLVLNTGKLTMSFVRSTNQYESTSHYTCFQSALVYSYLLVV